MLGFAAAVFGCGACPFAAVKDVIWLLRQQPLRESELGLRRSLMGGVAQGCDRRGLVSLLAHRAHCRVVVDQKPSTSPHANAAITCAQDGRPAYQCETQADMTSRERSGASRAALSASVHHKRSSSIARARSEEHTSELQSLRHLV